ncbi:SAM-dependent methyltransferase [Streptomyces chitinivorans]
MVSAVTPQSPSSTALTAAAARAAHLVVDSPPSIFADTLAEALLGAQAEELLGYHRTYGDHLVLSAARAQTVCRSRYTEECVSRAIHSGTRQYVILGAGLDTFAHRSELAGQVRVFEVDHPATQQDKRERLAAAGVPVPGNVTYVPLDFERETLVGGLGAHGFDPSRPSVVAWLGVSMYLTADSVAETLGAIGGFAPGTQLVMDYMLPGELRDATARQYADAVASFAAEHGEPWRTFFTPEDLTALLSGCGFESVGHVRQREMLDPALWDRQDALVPLDLSRIAHARTRG